MIGRALGEGFRSATRRPALVGLLWAWNLALALIMAPPFWRWIAGASGVLPGTDVLLDGADIGVISQLVHADPAVLAGLLAGAVGLVVVSLPSGAFLSGGLLEVVMTEGDRGPLICRFFRGAGHFFGRFLRLLAIAAVTLGIAAGLLAAGLVALTRPLANGGAEAAAFWAGLIVQGGVGLAIAFFMLAHDYARAMTVATGARSMTAIWLRALVFVVRHSAGAATIGLLAALAVLATVGACAAFDVAYRARTWWVIGAAILLQQVMAFLRTAVRVGQVSAQAGYWRGLAPQIVPAAGAPTRHLPLVPNETDSPGADTRHM